MINRLKLVQIIVFTFSISVTAQVTGFIDDFNDGSIEGWKADHERTFQLTNENNTLKVNYTRTSSSEPWDNFNFTPPQTIDISGKPIITFSVKSDIYTVLAIKPTNGNDVPLITQDIIGDGEWRNITFEINSADSKIIERMFLYFDGGSSITSSGAVFFDNISFGDSATIALDYAELNKAISAAESLLAEAVEGSGEGEYKAGSKADLLTAIDQANAFINLNSEDEDELNEVIWNMYDACVTFETSVNSVIVNLVDDNATKETKYLFLNMEEIAERSLIFGMHDATGYGVGWIGDNNRSDVKDVVGDFPAFYSEDLNKIQNNNDIEGVKYRMTSAYERGGILTMSWHQYDPDGRGFYDDDVNFERIVSYILPGGIRHEDYKSLLRKVAYFLKSLRGEEGESVPVIFRPYHEHTGSWFWWGDGHRTVQEYNQLWQFTTEYLRDSLNVHNLLYALSPSFSDVTEGDKYYNTYPGDDYVDIFGTDKYFSSSNISTSERDEFLSGIKTLVGLAKDKAKIMALTEIGNEGLTIQNWFSDIILEPIKNDETARNVSYMAVWRNANTDHFFAPYPGHSSVPDFLEFYSDPFTIFESDLPTMYELPTEDAEAPVFLTSFDTMLVSVAQDVQIEIETNERAFLKYSYSNEPYDNMPYEFTGGQGSYKHDVVIKSEQGFEETIYIHAVDDVGNTTDQPLVISFVVDTLQQEIAWYDLVYPAEDWNAGLTPIGTDADNVTMSSNVRTVYFRKTFELPSIPGGLAVQVRCKGGAAFYLNGIEISRISLPEFEDLTYTTNPDGFPQITHTLTLGSEFLEILNAGSNILSAEVHAPEGESVGNFDIRMFDDSYTAVIEYGSQWSFYDLGNMPASTTLGEVTGLKQIVNSLPAEYKLYQNYPNPFNPSTTIGYEISKQSNVKIEVYDILGSLVTTLVNDLKNPGSYEIRFNGSGLASGMYSAVLRAGDRIITRKMMLIK